MTRKKGRGKWLLAGAVVVLAAGASWYLLAFRLYDPFSANFDPLIRSIQRDRGSFWAGQAEMNPCCFDVGQQKRTMLNRLETSKFEADAPTGWHQKFFGAAYLTPTISIYSRSAQRFPCTDTFFIAVEFDEQDRLKKAEGTWINAVCL